MRHSIQIMFGRTSQEVLLGLKQYILQNGFNRIDDFAKFFHFLETDSQYIISEAVQKTAGDNGSLGYKQKYDAAFDEENSFNCSQVDSSAVGEFFHSLIQRTLVIGNQGNNRVIHFCFYVPLYDHAQWENAKKVIDIIKGLGFESEIDVLGIHGDLSNSMLGVNDNPKEAISQTENEKLSLTTIKEIVDYRKKGNHKIAHFLVIQNQNKNGISLNLTISSLVRVLGEFAMVSVSHYDDFWGTVNSGTNPDLHAFGVAAISVDKLYFIEFLVQKVLLHLIEKAGIKENSADFNKLSPKVQNVLKEWIHFMSTFFEKEVKDIKRIGIKETDIIATIEPKLTAKFDELGNEVGALIRDPELSIPEKRALMAIVLGDDDPAFKNDIYNENHYVINDIEREAVCLFVEANNQLLNQEETAAYAELSPKIDGTQTPAKYPLDDIKKVRNDIRRCTMNIRRLEDEVKSLEDLQKGSEEAEKYLVEHGTVTYKGHTFKILPFIPEKPLRETYEPHEVTATSCNLSDKFTEIKSQGHQGSCTAFAVTSVFEYFLKSNDVETPDLSERFLYYNARAKAGATDKDEGSCISLAIESLSEEGICVESVCPYNPDDFTEKPSDEAYQEALERKVKVAKNVRLSVDDVKSALEDGLPVIISANLYKTFYENKNGFIQIPTQEEIDEDVRLEKHGRHAMVICGYSDERNVFKVRNSWGKDFGDSGYCYLPYSYVSNSQLTNALYTIMEIETAKEVTTKQTIIEHNTFKIKIDERVHLHFGIIDNSIQLVLKNNALAKERENLQVLEDSYANIIAKYEELKNELSNPNIRNRIQEGTAVRLTLEKDQKAKEQDELIEERNNVVHDIKRKTVIGSIILIVSDIICWILGKIVFVGDIFQSLHNTFIYLAIGLIVVMAIYLLIRIHKRKAVEREYRETIEDLAGQIAKLEEELKYLKPKMYLNGLAISNFFQLSNKLVTLHNKTKSFVNNLSCWYDEYKLANERMEEMSIHPFVLLLKNDTLSEFCETNMDNLEEGLSLDDFLDFDLSEEGIIKLKNDLENTAAENAEKQLSDFTICECLTRIKSYPFVGEITDEKKNYLFKEIDDSHRGGLFLQCHASDTPFFTPNYVFVDIPNESNRSPWGTLLQKHSSAHPVSFYTWNPMRMSSFQLQELKFDELGKSETNFPGATNLKEN